jgi:hypothetical protein
MLTTDRLRHDIDRGRGGDKVDNIDPAAAPLGTDDEAIPRVLSVAGISAAAIFRTAWQAKARQEGKAAEAGQRLAREPYAIKIVGRSWRLSVCRGNRLPYIAVNCRFVTHQAADICQQSASHWVVRGRVELM